MAVLATLEAAVKDLELSLDGAELARCQHLLDRLSAKVGAAYGDFDAAALWDLDGATSMTTWLGDRAGVAWVTPIAWWPRHAACGACR